MPIDQTMLLWSVGILIGLLFFVLILNELLEWLIQQQSPLVKGLRRLRDVAIPLLALSLLLSQVLGLADSTLPLRIITSLVWLTAGYALFIFLNGVNTLRALPAHWLQQIPGIFFALSRAAVILIPAYYLLAFWGIEVDSLFTALGVGALALSFALQDTLSNLVSGLLLLSDRSFQPGDLIVVEDRRLRVEEVTWRTTRFIDDRSRTRVTIPNGNLGSEVIENWGPKANSHYRVEQEVCFSYDDPPNQVHQILVQILQNIEAVHQQPPPVIYLWSYDEGGITYQIHYYTEGWTADRTRDRLNRQLYYAAKRHGLTFAGSIIEGYEPPETDKLLEAQTRATTHFAFLRSLPVFTSLDDTILQEIISNLTVTHYGTEEAVTRQGQPDEGFYIVWRGLAVAYVRDQMDQTHEIERLTIGEFFGELTLVSQESSPISVIAQTDLETLLIDDKTIVALIANHSQFALDLNLFVEERTRKIAAAMGREMIIGEKETQNDWFALIRGM